MLDTGHEARLWSIWQEGKDVISEGAVQKLLLLALTLQQWYAAAFFAHIICQDSPALGQVTFDVILKEARQWGPATQASILSPGLPTMSDGPNAVDGKQVLSSGSSNGQTSQNQHAEEIVLHMHAEVILEDHVCSGSFCIACALFVHQLNIGVLRCDLSFAIILRVHMCFKCIACGSLQLWLVAKLVTPPIHRAPAGATQD